MFVETAENHYAVLFRFVEQFLAFFGERVVGSAAAHRYEPYFFTLRKRLVHIYDFPDRLIDRAHGIRLRFIVRPIIRRKIINIGLRSRTGAFARRYSGNQTAVIVDTVLLPVIAEYFVIFDPVLIFRMLFE